MSRQLDQGEHEQMETDSNGSNPTTSGRTYPKTAPQSPIISRGATPESESTSYTGVEPPSCLQTAAAIAQDEAVASTSGVVTADKQLIWKWTTLLGFTPCQFTPDCEPAMDTTDAANAIELTLMDLTVDSVLLGKNGATVTRGAVIKATQGLNSVTISHCKENILRGYPRIALDQKLSKSAIHSLYWDTRDYKSTESVKKRHVAREKYEKEKRQFKRQIDKLTEKHKLLFKTHALTRDNVLNPVTKPLFLVPDANLFNYIHRWNIEYESVFKALREAKDGLNRLEDEWKAIQAELPEDPTEDEYTYIAVLTFYAAVDGEERIQLTHSDPGYTWVASYNYHFMTRDEFFGYKPYVRFQYILTCKHDIDENWENVLVEVSTEELYSIGRSNTFTLPKLEVLTGVMRTTWRTLQKCIQQEIVVRKGAWLQPPSQGIDFEQQRLTTTRYTFRKNESVAILADHFLVACTKEYLCSPADISVVHCWMSFQFPRPYRLLPGEATVSLNNSFSYKAYVRGVKPLDILECSAGFDKCLHVLYRAVRSRHAAGVTVAAGRTNRNTLSNLLLLQNEFFPVSDPVTVLLPVPKESDDRIKVIVTNDTDEEYVTPPYRIEQEQGCSAVVMNLTPTRMSTETFIIKFVIDYPASFTLQQATVADRVGFHLAREG